MVLRALTSNICRVAAKDRSQTCWTSRSVSDEYQVEAVECLDRCFDKHLVVLVIEQSSVCTWPLMRRILSGRRRSSGVCPLCVR